MASSAGAQELGDSDLVSEKVKKRKREEEGKIQEAPCFELGEIVEGGGQAKIYKSPSNSNAIWKVYKKGKPERIVKEFKIHTIAYSVCPKNVPKPIRCFVQDPSRFDMSGVAPLPKMLWGKSSEQKEVQGILEVEHVVGKTFFNLEEADWATIDRRQTFLDLATTLLALHREKVRHGDLTLSNVMYDIETKSIKLIDYGYSFLEDDGTAINFCSTSRGYSAPEIPLRYLAASDWFSYGVIFYACLGLCEPTKPVPWFSVTQGTPQDRCFIAALTESNPALRLGDEHILQWPWFGEKGEEWQAPFWAICEDRKSGSWVKERVNVLWRMEVGWGLKVKVRKSLSWEIVREIIATKQVDSKSQDSWTSVTDVLLLELGFRSF